MAISAYLFLVNSDFGYNSAHRLSHNDSPVTVLFPRPTCKEKKKKTQENQSLRSVHLESRYSGC